MNIKSKLLMPIAAIALLVASCNKKDDIGNPSLQADGEASALLTTATGPWIVTTGNSGFAGNYYTYSSLPTTFPGSPSNTQGTQYSVGGRIGGGKYLTLGKTITGALGERGIFSFNSTLTPGTLQPGNGYLTLQTNEFSFYIHSNTVGYYVDADAVNPADQMKLYSFNPSATYPTTATLVVDFAVVFTGGATVTNPITGVSPTIKTVGSKMIIENGNFIYADVAFGNTTNALGQIIQPTGYKNAYIAAYNKTTGHITVSNFSNATNIALFNDHPLANVDQGVTNGAVYFATVGDMAASTANSKILKIDYNSATVNTSFSVDIVSDFSRIAEFNTLFVHDGIAYVKFATQDVRYLGSGHGVGYRSDIWQWAAIRLSDKTMKYLDIPLDNFYSYQQARLINNELYFIYNNASGGGIKKRAPLTPTTFGSAATPIPTTAVSTHPTGNYIYGLDRL